MENTANNSFTAKSRRKRALFNTIIGLIGELIVVLIGIFVPKAVILFYGSETNGIVNSLQQIVTYLTLFEAGLYGSTMVMLYKPMAENDINKINKICSAAARLYKIIGLIYCVGALALSFLYPLIAKQNTYSYFEIVGFGMSIFFACIMQSFVGSQYKVALMSAQKNGVVAIIRCFSLSVYYLAIIVLSQTKMHPLLVYFLADIAYVLRALLYYFASKKLLPGIKFNEKEKEKIKFTQTRSCLYQQICATLVLNSSIIILTFFAKMDVVSVFTIYNAVLSGIFLVLDQINQSMLTSFGNLNVENHERVISVYKEYTTLFSIICTVIFSCLGSLLYPFIVLYTSGVTDINYVEYGVIFSTIAIGMLWPFRNQQTVVLSAQGKYNQMNIGATIEMISVIGLSIGGYFLYGLPGLLIGKAIGIFIRLIECIITNNKKENMNSIGHTIKQILLCEVTSAIPIVLSFFLYKTSHFWFANWFAWILEALMVAVISLALMFGVRFVIDRKSLKTTKQFVLRFLQRSKSETQQSIEQSDGSFPETIEIKDFSYLKTNGKVIRNLNNRWDSNGVSYLNKEMFELLSLRFFSTIGGKFLIGNDELQISKSALSKITIGFQNKERLEIVYSKDKCKADVVKQILKCYSPMECIEKIVEQTKPLYLIFVLEKRNKISKIKQLDLKTFVFAKIQNTVENVDCDYLSLDI